MQKIFKDKKFWFIIIVLVLVIGLYFIFSSKFFKQVKEVSKFPNEIIEQLENSLKKDPVNTDLLFKLALEYHKINHYNREISLYKQLIKLKPEEPLYWYNLGMTYKDIQDYKNAVYYLQGGIKINYKLTNFYLPLIDLYENPKTRDLVDIDLIISKLKLIRKQSVITGPSEQDVLLYLARIYKIQGKYDQSLKLYKELLDSGYDNKQAIQEIIDEIKKLKQNKK